MFRMRTLCVLVCLAAAAACSGPSQPSPVMGSFAGADATPTSPSAPSANPMRATSDQEEDVAALGGVEGDSDMLAASTMTFKFAGKVESGTYAPRGTKFTGSYTFNPATRDSNANRNLGTYVMGAPFGGTISVVGRPVLRSTRGLSIRVRNNVANLEDDYEVTPKIQSGVDMRLFLRTRNKSAFLNDKLPLTPPRISSSMFNGVIEVYINNTFAILGTVTSLTK
jgi:hypothetical protein